MNSTTFPMSAGKDNRTTGGRTLKNYKPDISVVIMVYQELLNDENWHRKRLEIVRRDRNRCRSCENKRLLAMSKIAGLVGVPLAYQSDLLRKPNSIYSYRMTIRDPSSTQTIQTQIIKVYQDPLPNFWPLDFYYSSEKDLDENVRFFINCIHDKPLNDFVYVRGLQVHHTYYQHGRKPWEYPSDDLQTLCWMCHHELHATRAVPHLDTNGRQIGELTPCSRCAGSGCLPQYYYYMNGICFRCWGAQYDEFIQPGQERR